MKRVIKIILIFLIYIFRKFYPNKVAKKLKRFWYFIYSRWLVYEFKKCGNNTLFCNPIQLIGGNYISIGDNCCFNKNCIMTAWDEYNGCKFNPKISIGDNCCFGEYNHITSVNSVCIGDNVLTGRWVTITDNSHGNSDYDTLKLPPLSRNLHSKGEVVIGNNVWIGDKVTILPGVSIGDGVIVGANSVVTGNVPSFSIVVGNPTRVIKTYK